MIRLLLVFVVGLVHLSAGQLDTRCGTGAPTSDFPCGNEGITETNCHQLGCCWREGQCYMWGEQIGIVNRDLRPGDTPLGEYADYDRVRCSANTYDVSLKVDWTFNFNNVTKVCKVYGARWHSYRVASNWVDATNEETYEMITWDKGPRDEVELLGSKYDLLEKLYLGCYPSVGDENPGEDMEYEVWMWPGNTVDVCISGCRAAGYPIAGLNGDLCLCSHNMTRKADAKADSECNLPCPGDNVVNCGGSQVNSVYVVSPMKRFAGCYNDTAAVRKWMEWDAGAGRTAAQCIERCSEREDISNLRYYAHFAFVSDHGACSCSDQLALQAALITSPTACQGPCAAADARPDQFCGNRGVAAAYETYTTHPQRPAYPYSTTNWYHPLFRRMRLTETDTIPIESSTISGIPLNVFTLFPEMTAVLSPRLIIAATDRILAPFESARCTETNNCYDVCSDIDFTADTIRNELDRLTVRAWFFDLADLNALVGTDVDKVYVYAQVVKIDQSFEFDFALQIRARQIIIDRSSAHYITVNRKAPPLVDSYFDAKSMAPEPDVTYIKQTLSCAQMLVDTGRPDDYTTALEMLDDIGTDLVYNKEQEDVQTAIRLSRAGFTNLIAPAVSFVPFINKGFLKERVTATKTDLDNYIAQHKELIRQAAIKDEVFSISTSLLAMFVNTSLHQWEILYDSQKPELDSIRRVSETMYENYTYSVDIMQARQTEFEDALENKLTQQKRRAIYGFVRAYAKVVNGILVEDAKQVATATRDVFESVQNLEETLDYMSRYMERVERLLSRIEELTSKLQGDSGADLSGNAYDIEVIGQLSVMFIGWENMKHNAAVVLEDDDVMDQLEDEAEAYLLAIYDTCNFGKKLTEAMLDLGENYRRYMVIYVMLDTKRQLIDKYTQYIDDAKEKNDERASNQLVNQMIELQEDLRTDVNNIVADFCSYDYYESVRLPCPVAPQYDGTLDDLSYSLDKVLTDLKFWNSGIPRGTDVTVVIADTDTSEDCIDDRECPIAIFRKTGWLTITIDKANNNFTNYYQYRVSEVRLKLNGVQAGGNGNTFVSFQVYSSGQFALRQRGTGIWQEFISRPLDRILEFSIGNEANPDTAAQLYCAPQVICNSEFHRAPFTTWQFKLQSDVNVANVNSAEITFTGAFQNSLGEEAD